MTSVDGILSVRSCTLLVYFYVAGLFLCFLFISSYVASYFLCFLLVSMLLGHKREDMKRAGRDSGLMPRSKPDCGVSAHGWPSLGRQLTSNLEYFYVACFFLCYSFVSMLLICSYVACLFYVAHLFLCFLFVPVLLLVFVSMCLTYFYAN